MLVVSLIVAIYYNVIMAYSIIYVGVSFRGITDPEVIVLVLSLDNTGWFCRVCRGATKKKK